METFSVHFVLGSGTVDERGYLYAREVSLFEVSEFAATVERRTQHFSGGYCFVSGDRIWNATAPARYDPAFVYCSMDDVSQAYHFAACLGSGLPQSEPLRCDLYEVLLIEMRRTGSRMMSMVGKSFSGDIVYPELEVATADFFGGVLRASQHFLLFAKKLLPLVAKDPTLNGKQKAALTNKLRVPRWEAAVKQLRSVAAAENP